jgi:hypothetical protein
LVVVVVLLNLVEQEGTLIDWRRALVLADEVGIDMVSIRPFGVAGFGLVVWKV